MSNNSQIPLIRVIQLWAIALTLTLGSMAILWVNRDQPHPSKDFTRDTKLQRESFTLRDDCQYSVSGYTELWYFVTEISKDSNGMHVNVHGPYRTITCQ